MYKKLLQISASLGGLVLGLACQSVLAMGPITPPTLDQVNEGLRRIRPHQIELKQESQWQGTAELPGNWALTAVTREKRYNCPPFPECSALVGGEVFHEVGLGGIHRVGFEVRFECGNLWYVTAHQFCDRGRRFWEWNGTAFVQK